MVALKPGEVGEPRFILPHSMEPALLAGEIIPDEGSSNISWPRVPPVIEAQIAVADNRLDIVISIKFPFFLSRPAELGCFSCQRLVAPMAVTWLYKLGSANLHLNLICFKVSYWHLTLVAS